MDPDLVVPTRKERDDLYGLSESQMSKFLGGWWSFMIRDPLTGSTSHEAPSKRLTSEGPFSTEFSRVGDLARNDALVKG